MREKKEINKRIGSNIRAAREDARYTQEQLSEILGITPNHLSAIERGASGATLEMLEKLCGQFGVTADDLFFGKAESDDPTIELARRLSSVAPECRPQIRKVLMALLELLDTQK